MDLDSFLGPILVAIALTGCEDARPLETDEEGTSTAANTEGDGGETYGSVNCENQQEVEPRVPEACAGVVTDGLQQSSLYPAVFVDSTTVLGTTHTGLWCSQSPDLDDIECPCINDLFHITMIFDEPNFEVGESTARMRWVEASQGDSCNKNESAVQPNNPDAWPEETVELLAVTDACMVVRFAPYGVVFVDRTADCQG